MFSIESWLPFLLAKNHQFTFGLMKKAVEPFDLTPPQFATLAFLWAGDGVNQQELGTKMHVDRTTISGIIERLEKLGYVQRDESPEDGRSYKLFVTKKGREIQKPVLSQLQEVQNHLDMSLSRDEQDQLLVLLQKLRTAK